MLADYAVLADGNGKGCYEKTGIYSFRLNGVSAMAAFDSTPGSGHSAVALETAHKPQKGMNQLLSLSLCKVEMYPGETGEEAVGADLYTAMIS